MDKPTTPGYYRFRGNDSGAQIGWLIGYWTGKVFQYRDGQRRKEGEVLHSAYLFDLAGEWDGPIPTEPPGPLPCGHPVECFQINQENSDRDGCRWCEEVGQLKARIAAADDISEI